MRDIFEIKDNFSLYKDVKSVLEYGNEKNCPHPEVSIVIPCYNHPDFFKKALVSALNQDYQGVYEIVVVDNDDSKEITSNREIVEELNSPKVLYYHNQQNIGMFGNWNRCIELARAPYLTFLHDDDMLLPSCLSTLMKYPSKFAGRAVLGLRNYINEQDKLFYVSPFEGKKKKFIKYKEFYKYSLYHHFVNPLGYCIGTLFYRNNMINLGGFSPDFYPCADAAFVAIYVKRYGAIQPLKATHNYRFAENETYKVYSQFADSIKHTRICIKPYLIIPDVVLDRIITAFYRTLSFDFEQAFNNNSFSIKKPSKIDIFITKICLKIVGISKYTLTLR